MVARGHASTEVVIICISVLLSTLPGGTAEARSQKHAATPTPRSLLPIEQAFILGQFDLAYRRAELPPLLRQQLEREQTGIAEMGEPFNAGCVVDGKSPRRRLLFAGKSQELAFAVFQQGGIALTTQLLLGGLTGPHGGTWCGYFIPFPGSYSVADLQTMLVQGQLPVASPCGPVPTPSGEVGK
jgi:hypothetical protein